METSFGRLKHPDIDATDLAFQMRKATERTSRPANSTISDRASAQPDLQMHPNPSTDALGQLPRLSFDNPTASENDECHVRTLMQFGDREFVHAAYRVILGREPDRAGYDSYLESLRRGTLDKIDVIVGLQSSEEGRQRSVRIRGLALPLWLRRLRALPIVGYPLGLCLDILRLPILVQRLQRSIVISDSRTQQMAEHLNQLQQQSQDAVAGLLSSANAAAESLESVSAQVVEMRRQQEQTEQQLQDHVQQQISSLRTEFQSSLERRMRDSQAQIDELQKQALDLATSNVRSATELDDAFSRIQHLRRELAMQGRYLTRVAEAPSKDETAISTVDTQHHLDALYTALEDRFRGSRESIKKLFEFYLTYIEQLSNADLPIADIGCGRGEWLELLKQQGVKAFGIDANQVALGICREHELEVVEADAVSQLTTMSDDSLRAVTAFHLLEHLSIDKLVTLLDEIVRTIRPGGALIIETPNPDNLFVASNYFYFDPTHRKPLPSALLKFLVESRGFEQVEIINLHPCPEGRFQGADEVSARLNDLFYGPMDYAIVGWKLGR